MDNRPRVTPTKDINLVQFAAELGDDRLARNDETGELVHNGDVTQQQLEDAVAAHVAETPPDPDAEFRDAVTAAVSNEPAGSPLRKLADALLGTSGPGAEPRRGPA